MKESRDEVKTLPIISSEDSEVKRVMRREVRRQLALLLSWYRLGRLPSDFHSALRLPIISHCRSSNNPQDVSNNVNRFDS